MSAPQKTPPITFLHSARKGAYQLVRRRERPPVDIDAVGRYRPTVVGSDVKRLTPGLNLATEDERLRFGLDELPEDIRPIDPVKVPEAKAREIVKTTASKRALQAWLPLETRPKIKSALEERIKAFR